MDTQQAEVGLIPPVLFLILAYLALALSVGVVDFGSGMPPKQAAKQGLLWPVKVVFCARRAWGEAAFGARGGVLRRLTYLILRLVLPTCQSPGRFSSSVACSVPEPVLLRYGLCSGLVRRPGS